MPRSSSSSSREAALPEASEAPEGPVPSAEGPRKHRLFGLTLVSDFPFESRLAPGEGRADLLFSTTAEAPAAARLGAPLYESHLVDEASESLARLYRLPEGELLRFGSALDFYLGRGEIGCHLRDAGRRELVEIRLLGPVLSYWLERLAICVLHASAVVVDGRAVAFIATSRGGKSVLAATMMAGGAPLLTDDLLPVEPQPDGILARPGYPQMRMWPDGLANFIADERRRAAAGVHLGKHWVPVGADGFGAFHGEPVPLGRLYLPQRLGPEAAGKEVGISTLPPRQAIIELLRCSFSPHIVEAVGLQPERLETFARLVRQVPIRRLTYRSGFDALPELRAAVLGDLESG